MSGAENAMERARLAALGAEFASIAAALHDAGSDGVDCDRLVRVAATAVPNAEHCGITLIRGHGKPLTLASTGPLAQAVDDLQYAFGEGPCLDASRGDGFTEVEDLSRDGRWPAFAAACVERTGVRSILSVRLALCGDDRAALNLYASPPGTFHDLDVGISSILAPFVALSVQKAVHQSDLADFQEALTSSRQIGRAVGIVMANHLVQADRAFELLTEASRHLNRRLLDVAEEVELTGVLPDDTDSGAEPGR